MERGGYVCTNKVSISCLFVREDGLHIHNLLGMRDAGRFTEVTSIAHAECDFMRAFGNLRKGGLCFKTRPGVYRVGQPRRLSGGSMFLCCVDTWPLP